VSTFTEILYKYDSTGKVRTFQIEIDGDRYRMITGTKDGKKVESKWTVCTAKNVGKSNELNPEQQAIVEAEARINKKLSQNYYRNEEDCIANPEQFFQVMLAIEWAKVKPEPKFPLILDPKLDGMRLVVTPETYHSRKGKEVPTACFIAKELEPFFEQYPNIILDGEIYCHDLKSDFNELMSIARKTTPDEEDLAVAEQILEYHIYDLYDTDNPDMNAATRKMLLDQIIPKSKRIKVVSWVAVQSQDELKAINQLHVKDGYEGSIARTPGSMYENKRSKNLIKIKKFITEEFLISDIVEGTGNRSGIAGTVEVRVGSVSVGCGIRGSWKYAKELLDNKHNYIGRMATVRHFGFTPDGSLRFPICIDLDRPD
jgi:ATP-dependent DNA ligase